MRDCHNLEAVRQFPVKQPIREWLHAVGADGLFIKRPQLRIALYCHRLDAHGIQKIASETWLLFIVILRGLGEFPVRHAQISDPLHLTFR